MSNGYKTEFQPHKHNVVCAVCQAYFKSDQVRRNWEGVLVCDKDWDPKPITLIPETYTPNDPRPVERVQGNDNAADNYFTNDQAGITNDIWVDPNA